MRSPSCSPTAAYRPAYGSNTFSLISGGGERHWVKFHFKTCQGINTWTNGEDVRELELNRNPENYFVEIEQASFSRQTLCQASAFRPTRCCRRRGISLGCPSASPSGGWLGVTRKNRITPAGGRRFKFDTAAVATRPFARAPAATTAARSMK
jgi:hypothetical protein